MVQDFCIALLMKALVSIWQYFWLYVNHTTFFKDDEWYMKREICNVIL